MSDSSGFAEDNVSMNALSEKQPATPGLMTDATLDPTTAVDRGCTTVVDMV
jgi:hypothetical protein